MKNMEIKEVLEDINYNNKVMNNNLTRLCNIGLLSLVYKSLEKSKENEDATGILLGKICLLLICGLQLFLSVLDIKAFFEKQTEEAELCEPEED